MSKSLTSLSKFCSLVLRHQPETIGLLLDANGWAEIEQLVERSRQHGISLTRTLLEKIVVENTKNRFEISDDQKRIRARQGHSIEVNLELPVAQPPPSLYHGTATRFLDSILEKGLLAGTRQHVNLSSDIETARTVGNRHGQPVVLTILAEAMTQSGHIFHLSTNGVWLTAHVPTEFIHFPKV